MNLVYASVKIILVIFLLAVLMIKEKNKNKDYKFLLMEIFTLAGINLTVPKATASIIGKMDQTIEDNFFRECVTEEVFGK
jgi:hypothetical protein